MPSLKKVTSRGLVIIEWNVNIRRPRKVDYIETGKYNYTSVETRSTEEKPILEVLVEPGETSDEK